jgi:UDP-glucose 4-epimerase
MLGMLAVMTIPATGDAGYIGSRTVVELLDGNYDVVVIDDFSNSSPEVLKRIEKITGKKPELYKGDVSDKTLLQTIFKENSIYGVASVCSR